MYILTIHSPVKNISMLRYFLICFILTTYFYPLANKVVKGCNNATVRPSFHPSCRPSVLPYLVLRRVWNPIDFQGHKSKVKVTGSNFYSVASL